MTIEDAKAGLVAALRTEGLDDEAIARVSKHVGVFGAAIARHERERAAAKPSKDNTISDIKERTEHIASMVDNIICRSCHQPLPSEVEQLAGCCDGCAGVEQWASAVVTCAVCSHEWGAVYPATCVQLQCPSCRYMNVAPPLPT